MVQSIARGTPSLSNLLDPRAEWRDRIAVDDGQTRWTYVELHARANRIAQWLVAAGVKSGNFVAVHAERRAATIAALHRTMKAGAAFMLLDAEHSSERLLLQVEAAKPVAWLSATAWDPALGSLDRVFPEASRRLDVTRDDEAMRALSDVRPAVDVDLDAPAYVVFTSGTTGKPKGIVGSLRPVLHFLDWHLSTFAFGADDRFSGLSGIAHDPFLRDVLTPLAIGASVHLPTADVRVEPERLAAWLAESRISVAHVTPSLGEILAFAGKPVLPDLRHVFFGGEALRSQLVERLRPQLPNARFVNFYGTTETPQAIAWFELRGALSADRVPIGKGIDGVELVVLTDDGRVSSSANDEGEVCVRTRFLALGYLDGSKGGFTTSPLSDDPQDRMYRTGDRGRITPSGDVEILGRRDQQVKVRGFRVELDDVEQAIGTCPGIRQSAAFLHPTKNTLVAFVTVEGDRGAAANVTALLRAKLPDYMVPGTVVALDKLPLTPNGKVDKSKLPDIDSVANEIRKHVPDDVDAPANDAERLVADVWQNVLGADRVRRHDNFFDLGGHSLNATQVAAKLREAFGMEIAVRVVFEAPTVAELAQRIVALRSSAGSEPRGSNEARRGRGAQKGGKPPENARGKASAGAVTRSSVPSGSVTSFWQDSVLAWERRRSPSSTWNFPVAIRFDGNLDTGALVEAVAHVLDRQESLRQILHRDAAKAPSLCGPGDAPVPFVDMAAASDDDLTRFVESDVNAPFLLDGSPLVRFRLVRRGDEVHELHAAWHQLVSDATPKLFCDEVLEAYSARVEKRADKLPALPVRFVDRAVAERAWAESPDGLAQLAEARARIAGATPVPLPVVRPRDGAPSTVGIATSYYLDAGEVERVSKLFRTANVSFFMGMSTIASVLLACLTGGDDVSMITPYAARVARPELQMLIGRFSNWLPLRLSCGGDPTFGELLARMRADLLRGFAVAEVPASLVYGTQDVFGHDLSRVVLNMPELGKPGPVIRQVPGAKVSIDGGVLGSGCRSEVALMLMRNGPRCWVEVQGASSLFDEPTVVDAGEMLRKIVRSVELDTRLTALR